MSRTVITEELARFIYEHRLRMPASHMAKSLGISKSTILNFMNRNRIQPPADLVKKWRYENRKPSKFSLTDAEKRFIEKNYLDMPIMRIAKAIGRSKTAVRNYVKRAGLVIPPEILEDRVMKTQFKKGQISINRGRSVEEIMSPENARKWRQRQFKRGGKPANTEPVGTLKRRTDYWWIKLTEEGEWKAYHRHQWEKHRGSIPSGYMVTFKDGNPDNYKLDNLELITMAENLRRNRLKNHPRKCRDRQMK